MFKQIIQDIGEQYVPIIRPKTQHLLIKTLKKHKPHSILEIGSGVGYSGCVMLQTIKNAHLTTIELDQQRANSAIQNFDKYGFTDRSNVIIGDASTVLNQLNNIYDFIFLDGPKGQYYKYLPILTKLLSPNGIIFADDINLMGYVLDYKADVPHKHRSSVMNLRKYIDMVTNKPYQSKIYKIEDGVCITTLAK